MADEVADVLVIGSGPSGAAVTKRLTDLGAKVVCLEQGDWMRPSDYPADKAGLGSIVKARALLPSILMSASFPRTIRSHSAERWTTSRCTTV